MIHWSSCLPYNDVNSIYMLCVILRPKVGFSVIGSTLNRCYRLCYSFPFHLAGFIIVHLVLLHTTGSNITLGMNPKCDKIPFHIYFIIKDDYGFILISIFISFIIFVYQIYLGNAENFINENP